MHLTLKNTLSQAENVTTQYFRSKGKKLKTENIMTFLFVNFLDVWTEYGETYS